MELKTLLDARRNKEYVCIEDPINGSRFVPQNTRVMNSYVLTVNNDIQKFKKYHLEDKSARTTKIIFEETDAYCSLDTEEEIVVLKRIYNLPEEIKKIMEDKYKIIGEERLSMCNVYTLNKIKVSDITQKLLNNDEYPYYFTNTEYIDGKYVSVLYVLYNSDVLVPRLASVSEDKSFFKASLDSTHFATQCLDSDNMNYLFKGHYLRMKDSVLQLVDIDNCGFIFRDILRNRYKTFPISHKNIQNIVESNRCIDKEYLCFARTKFNDPLFLYPFANDENKALYDKKQLLDIYENLIRNSKKEDSMICIIDDEIEAVYTSKKVFME